MSTTEIKNELSSDATCEVRAQVGTRLLQAAEDSPPNVSQYQQGSEQKFLPPLTIGNATKDIHRPEQPKFPRIDLNEPSSYEEVRQYLDPKAPNGRAHESPPTLEDVLKRLQKQQQEELKKQLETLKPDEAQRLIEQLHKVLVQEQPSKVDQNDRKQAVIKNVDGLAKPADINQGHKPAWVLEKR